MKASGLALVVLGLAGPALSQETRPAPAEVVVPEEGTQVPMEDWGGRPVLVAGVAGGGELRLHLDTGTGYPLVLSAQAAGRLGLETGSGVGAMGLVPAGTVEALYVGDAELLGVPAEVLPMLDHHPIDGILGLSCFETTLLTIDYGARRFELARGDLAAGGRGVVSFERDETMGGAISMPARAGEAELVAHLDTGSPDVLLIPHELCDLLPLDGEPRVIGRARTPMGEADISEAVLLGTLVLGAVEIESPTVRIADLPQIVGKGIGNVGSGALREARLTIDLENQRLAIVPSAPEALREASSSRPGGR